MGKRASGVYKPQYAPRLEDTELAERCLIVGEYRIRFGGMPVTVEAKGERLHELPAALPQAQAVEQALAWVQAAYHERDEAERAVSLVPAAKRRFVRMTGCMI